MIVKKTSTFGVSWYYLKEIETITGQIPPQSACWWVGFLCVLFTHEKLVYMWRKNILHMIGFGLRASELMHISRWKKKIFTRNWSWLLHRNWSPKYNLPQGFNKSNINYNTYCNILFVYTTFLNKTPPPPHGGGRVFYYKRVQIHFVPFSHL